VAACTASLRLERAETAILFKEAPIEQDIRCEFADLPNLHLYTDDTAKEFME